MPHFDFSVKTLCFFSSLYFDEDGDLAHEFYEETVVTKNGRRRSKLKRIQKNLIPQVSVDTQQQLHSMFSQKLLCLLIGKLFIFRES